MARRHLIMLAGALLAGCGDGDGDGQGAGRDCDDEDPRVFRGAVEICDGVDNDCNGQIDEGVAIVAFQDRDGDGFGDPDRKRRVCEMPADGVDNGDDCDDFDPTSAPGATEVCDRRDNDCDGAVDEDLGATFYADADGDGHGVPGATTTACFLPEGYSRLDDDCDDADARRWTDAPELCDGVDNDCDDAIDEDLPDVLVYVDADGDGYGDPDVLAYACGPATGFALDGLDCDDGDPTLNPDTVELEGDGVDDDCDGWVDELAVPTAYATIEAALAAADVGDVVQLGAGVFVNGLDLTGRDLTLAGEGCGRTVLTADGAGTTLMIDAGTVADMTITGGLDTGLMVLGDVAGHGLCVEGNYDTRFGGGVEVVGGTFTLTDSLIARNTSGWEGGGMMVDLDAELIARRVWFVDNLSGGDGGAIAFRSGHGDIRASVFAGNTASGDGGALYLRQLSGMRPGPPPEVLLRHVTLHGNELLVAQLDAYQDDYTGVAARIQVDGTLRIERSLITGHGLRANVPLFPDIDGSITISETLIDGVGVMDHRDGDLIGALRGDPRYLDVTGEDPASWDLRLRPGSPAIDAAAGGDLDTDGTPADLGAFGGPDALAGGRDAYQTDDDGDGMADAWELLFGLAPWVDDGGVDSDGDGLDAVGEHDLGGLPTEADSDGDGVDDGAEAAAGTDPARAADHHVFASLVALGATIPGEPVALDARTSFDPDGAPLSFTWSVVPPPGSAVAGVSGSGAEVTLTPDVSGPWSVQVTVGDGDTTDTTTHALTVRAADVVVPDDVAQLSTAIASAVTGDVIAVRPGTWAASVPASTRSLTLIGLGAPADVVIDSVGGTVVDVGAGQGVELRQVTLTGGRHALGGGVSCSSGDVVLRDVIVRGNEAVRGATGGHGGGLSLVDCTLDAERITVRDNTADVDGGGLYIDDSEVRLVASRILHNDAGDDGGGMWVRQRGDTVTVSATVLQGNTANDAAAIFLDGPTGYAPYGSHAGYIRSMVLDGVVFADHASSGALLWIENGRMRVRDALFAHNTTGTLASGDAGTDFQLLFGHLWGNSFANTWGIASWVPRYLRTWASDPGVIGWRDDGDPDDDVWTPRPGSGLIDAGWPERDDADGSPADGGLGGPDAPRAWRIDQVDGDGDGMSDGWELRFGLDPRVDDAAGDRDLDGQSNLAEYLAGTRP